MNKINTTPFKKRLKRLFFIFATLFVLLFVFRLIYGYTKTNSNSSEEVAFFESISSSRKNYASKEYKTQKSTGQSIPTKVDQKYEKVAEIKTKSTAFEKEEKLARDKINDFNALIQFEQKSGNNGYRRLNLVVGVPPENFDSLYQQLILIGTVEAKQITKKDKTNEYKELNARKQSLEKIRTSLIDLKTKSGKIEEYMDLENRILDIEQQLQNLGVSLGDFDDENEFCTVQFSLLEGKEVQISLMHRVKVALEWSIKYYLRVLGNLLFMLLCAYILLLGIDKLKIIQAIMNKKDL